jgi:hypothetical protein
MFTPIQLTLRRPGRPDRRHDLAYGVYPVGSDADNRIVLPGDGIAWRHAIISFMAEGAWLEDLGSQAGTRLDGKRVTGRLAWAAGQELEIGTYRMAWQRPRRCAGFLFRGRATRPDPACPRRPLHPPVAPARRGARPRCPPASRRPGAPSANRFTTSWCAAWNSSG